MFGSTMVEVAIGLIFLFLLMSLICSAASEIIESWLKMRAADLERGIRELLNDPKGLTLTQKLYDHPLIFGLFKGNYDPTSINKKGRYATRSKLPSYIPARTFALALMDTILPAAKATPSGAAGATPTPTALISTPRTPQPLRSAITMMGNPKVEQAMMALVDAAGDDIGKVRENIEVWYDTVMDRVTGWYKRRTQVILLLLGLAVAIVVNADTVTIAKSLSHDQALRSSLVAAAQEYAKSQPQGAADSSEKPEKRVRNNLEEIKKLGLPVGWNKEDPRTWPENSNGWIAKVLGWLLMAIAISLGAPFWFDLLNKFMVARSSLKSR